jgi:Leucine-rich repeat (LRR) protein
MYEIFLECEDTIIASSKGLYSVVVPGCKNLILDYNYLSECKVKRKLEFLSLVGNSLSKQPSLLQRGLTFLNLAYNDIEVLDFTKLPKSLEVLIVEANPIRTVIYPNNVRRRLHTFIRDFDFFLSPEKLFLFPLIEFKT